MAKGFEFEGKANEVKKQLGESLIKGITEACLLVQAQAKMLTPVKTGQLRDSIEYKVQDDAGEVVGEVGTHLEHGLYVEFGTGEFAENGQGRKGGWVYEAPDGEMHFTYGQKPQAFLKPAFRENKNNIEKILGQVLKNEMSD